MDDRRFDDLTKLVGRRASRRTVIRAAIAGAIASVFGGSIAEAALSPIKTRPRLCIQPGQRCAKPGTDPSRDCCYKCNNSARPYHLCCENIGYLCTTDTDCCVKVVNGQNVQPICRDPQAAGADRRKACFLPGTLNPGAQCTEGSDCASGNCVNGVCSACGVGTTVCGANCCNTAQCQVCVGGVCKSKCGPCQTCNGQGVCVNNCDSCRKCVNNQCVPKCSTALCQTCDPNTGVCSTCNGDKCKKCVNGQCVDKCTKCQTCNPVDGTCTPKPCPNCYTCNPASGICDVPKVCGQCQTCDPVDGFCKSTCSACERCQNNICVSNCPACSTCNPITGGCDEILCGPCEHCENNLCVGGCPDLCEPCDPYTGLCEPIPCGACAECDSLTGLCESVCLDCEICDELTGGCLENCEPCEFCDAISELCEPCSASCLRCDPYTLVCIDACDPGLCQVCNQETDTCDSTCLPGQVCTCGTNTAAGQCQVDYFQGFESDTAGWSAPITRVPSGTNGVTSKTGGFHAEAGNAPSTTLGGYSNVFPSGGYTVSLDIYLDPSNPLLTVNDTRFDWSSAVNDPNCNHRRDFVFNAGFYNDDTVPGSGPRFIISGSNNTDPGSSFPWNPGNSPIAITTAGWYTFQHVFSDQAGVLQGVLSIIDASNVTVGTWIRSDPSDIIGVTVGGNRYGWLLNNELPYLLPIDNSSRT